jgi:imidazolonepropionase-like amidohydrolase
MNVLVVGERIEKIFPNAGPHPDIVRTAKLIELGSRFLIPGLIDAHVHLTTPPNRREGGWSLACLPADP